MASLPPPLLHNLGTPIQHAQHGYSNPLALLIEALTGGGMAGHHHEHAPGGGLGSTPSYSEGEHTMIPRHRDFGPRHHPVDPPFPGQRDPAPSVNGQPMPIPGYMPAGSGELMGRPAFMEESQQAQTPVGSRGEVYSEPIRRRPVLASALGGFGGGPTAVHPVGMV